VVFKKTLLSVVALTLLWGAALAELNVVKDFRYPYLRTYIMNPQSLPNPCVIRKYRVLHRRDAKGRPYDLEVTPIGDAEQELVSSVIEAFYRWRFIVPGNDEWKVEFLSITHENTFWTEPPCACDSSCEEVTVDEESRTVIE
jgi:hypothetical protein